MFSRKKTSLANDDRRAAAFGYVADLAWSHVGLGDEETREEGAVEL